MASCRAPLVVVLGTTGAGKSKLAIEIAKAFKGEIISADSMQIYKGLDIITNKVTAKEQQECPHHMISYLEADHKHYNIVDFRDAVVPIINGLLTQRILPVVVGGTNYYIESVLWNFLVDKKDSTRSLHENHHTSTLHRVGKQNGASHQLRTSNAELQVDNSHKCTNESGIKIESSNMKAHVTSQLSTGAQLLYNLGLTQPGSETPPSAQLAAFMKSSLPSGNAAIELNTPFHTLCGQPACLISASYASGSPSFQPRVSCPHSGSNLYSEISQTSASLDSAGLPPPDSSLRNPNTTNEDNAICKLSLINCSNDYVTSDGHHLIDASAEDSSVAPRCFSSSCEREDSLPDEASLGNVGDSAVPTPSIETKLENRYPYISKSQLGTLGLSSDVSESIGLSSVDNNNHSLIHNPGDSINDYNAILRCIQDMSPEDLYSHLQNIDPKTASRMHPNNQRKIVRAIQVYYETGRTLSSLLDEQHGGMDDAKSGPLRYPDLCILWVKCRQPDLNERLDSRVDDMMARGLVAELDNFHKEVIRLEELELNSSSEEDKGLVYPHGVLQMIGFKEFHDYLQLSTEERNKEQGQKVLHKAVSDLKQATRRYARQQIRWITNRFCNRPGPSVPPIYSVDSTDLSQWDKTVEEAIEIVKAFITGVAPSKAPEMVIPKVDTHLVRNICDVCGGQIFLYLHEWTGHLKSNKHRSNVKMAAARRKLSNLLSAREQQLRQQTNEAENQNTPEAENQNTPEAESRDTPEAESQDTPEAESRDTPEAESRDTPEAESQDTHEAESQDTHETESQDTHETESRDTPEAESRDTPEAESRDTPEAESRDTPEAESRDTPEAESRDTSEAETHLRIKESRYT